MDKSKFLVVSNYGKNVDQKKELTSNLFEPVINLQNVNLQQLLTNLQDNLDKKPSWFIFRRRNENEKIRIESEKIGLIIESIELIKKANKSFVELQADQIFAPDLLNFLIEERTLDFKHSIQLKIHEHQDKLHQIEMGAKKREMENLDAMLNLLEKKTKMKLLNASIEEQTEYVNMLREMRIKTKKMSTGAALAVIHEIVNRHKLNVDGSIFKDFDTEETYKELRVKLINEEVKQAESKSKSGKAQADFDEFNTNKKMGKL